MTAAELREALAWESEFRGDILQAAGPKWQTWAEAGLLQLDKVFDAARTIALPILEADPELVERLARIIHEGEGWSDWGERPLTVGQQFRLNLAKRVLAAISTPTPGAE